MAIHFWTTQRFICKREHPVECGGAHRVFVIVFYEIQIAISVFFDPAILASTILSSRYSG